MITHQGGGGGGGGGREALFACKNARGDCEEEKEELICIKIESRRGRDVMRQESGNEDQVLIQTTSYKLTSQESGNQGSR
jgi:hypothetical protein